MVVLKRDEDNEPVLNVIRGITREACERYNGEWDDEKRECFVKEIDKGNQKILEKPNVKVVDVSDKRLME